MKKLIRNSIHQGISIIYETHHHSTHISYLAKNDTLNLRLESTDLPELISRVDRIITTLIDQKNVNQPKNNLYKVYNIR